MNDSTLILSGDFFFAFMIFLIALLIFLLSYCVRLRHRNSTIKSEYTDGMEELITHHTFLDLVFKNLPDQLYYKDRQARLLGINPACYLHHGASSAEELLGKTDAEIKPGSVGQLSYEQELRQMDENETIRNREEYTLKDGTLCHIENIKKPLLKESGEVIGLVGVTRDISAQVKNEQERVLAQKEAEDANKAKSSFLAMMSHEIRTPMHGIIGAASLLKQAALSSDQMALVDTIETSGEGLMTVLNDILDYSKIEAGKIQLEMIPFTLRNCIHEAFNLFTEPANEKQIELLLYTDNNVPEALAGDPSRLRQILLNLIGNAVKFTKSGEICVHVQFLPKNETVDHPHLQFSVRDTGVGIPKATQKKLFNAFTQADISSTREYGGTGLGLVISRRLAELMGGTMWLESQENEGSTFYFTIDLPTSSPVRSRALTPPKNGLTGQRVLLVDDNETNRNILTTQLETWGAETVAFSDPEEVLPHLRKHPPYDLAILDYRMPKMNGADLAKAIHSEPDIQIMPIVLLSSSYEEISHHPSVSFRLAKPVRIKKLHNKLIELLSTEEKPKTSPQKPQTQSLEKDTTTSILLVEDKPENQALICKMIKAVGYLCVQTADDGLEALNAVKDTPFDIILMDVQMPNMNGLESTKAIRKHTQSRKKPWIVGLTAGVTQEERDLMDDSGMNDLLPKPMKLDQLKTTLDKAKDLLAQNKPAL